MHCIREESIFKRNATGTREQDGNHHGLEEEEKVYPLKAVKLQLEKLSLGD